MAPSKIPFRDQVAQEMIDRIEKGTAPWQKPWKPGMVDGLPFNPTTNASYRGINDLWLTLQGYQDPRWMTFNQAKAQDASVRKGEKATTIEYWQWTKQVPALDDNGNHRVGEDGKKLYQTVRLERPKVFYAKVFNAEQIDGLKPYIAPEPEFDSIERAEQIMSSANVPVFHDQPDRAFYRPSSDEIHLPPKTAFKDAGAYYSTALHELGHATGHESRLHRPFGNTFGTEGYAREELRAELSSYMVSRELGLPHDPGQQAAYLDNWLEALKKDKHEIFRAAADAEKIKTWVLEPEKRQELERAAQQRRAVEQSQTPNASTLTNNVAVSEPEQSPPKEQSMSTTAPTGDAEQPKRANRVYIAVPYTERNEAKKHGARWDKTAKSWYFTANQDRSLFAKWDTKQSVSQQNSMSPVDEFTEILKSAGYIVNEPLKVGSKWNRIPMDGDKRGQSTGSYRMFLDGAPNIQFRSYKTGELQTHYYTGIALSPEEKAKLQAEAAQVKEQRTQERRAGMQKAAKIAYGIFINAKTPATPENAPYLKAKGVQGYGSKLTDSGELVVPIYRADDRLVNVQFIKPTGKIYLENAEFNGTLHTITGPEGTGKLSDIKTGMGGTIILCEGKATGDTLHEATGRPTVVAWSAGNLLNVANVLKEKFPERELLIVADNDHKTIINGKHVNVGVNKATEAAEQTGSLLAIPSFTDREKSQGLTDANDLAASRGKQSVRNMVNRALSKSNQRGLHAAATMDMA